MVVKKLQEPQFENTDSGSKSIVYLWCLRMLMLCGGHRKFIERKGFRSDEVLSLLYMDDYAEKDIERSAIIKLLRSMHADAEKQSFNYPQVLLNNLSHILDRISLNKIETDILIFSIMTVTEEGLGDCTEILGNLDKAKLIRNLSNILGHSQRNISTALSAKGQLALSGLLTIDANWSRDMKSKVDLMQGLADNLLVPDVDVSRLFAGSFIEGCEPKLGSDSFEHVKKQYMLMKDYITQSLNKTSGVNILLYGLPGTGKTEMVRTLTKDAGAVLYDISMEDADGDPLNGRERFSAYKLSQQMLSHAPDAVILFDEIEDVFPEPSLFGKPDPRSTEKKAWINRLLESNKVPAFWLSNKVYQIDDAFLRRFDYILEMPSPTIRMRKKLFAGYLDKLPVSERWLKKMSSNRNLQPAHIEKAAKVAHHLATKSSKKNEAILENILNGTQEILGLHTPHSFSSMATSYSLDYISANIDILNMVKGLKRSRRGNICFYGPPGTGKTALGQYIAEHLDRPLIVKRASDILDMYVGGTERNIAAMFREAKREDGVLLLDEADSFLRDRRGANRSWEVTQVNELLVQMENFDGLFICSTNLMDDLDQASLRRFAIKVEFDYLTTEQAWNILCKESVGKPSEFNQKAISNLDSLTPGDFAAVKNKLEILGKKAVPDRLVSYLEEECVAKNEHSSNAIGFLQ